MELLSQMISALTPVVVPAMLAGLKRLFQAVPRPLLPALAVLAGAGVDWVNQALTGAGAGAAWGGVLGALGITVRELFVRIREELSKP